MLSFSPQPPTRLQRLYRATWGRVFAALYDRFLAGAEAGKLGRLRAGVVGDATGVVLDIGAGTGINLQHLAEDAQIIMAEPDPHMASRLAARAAALGRDVDLVLAPGEQLPLDDGSVDHVLCTLVLCTVSDPAATLREAHRVLRPGGTLHLLEHVRSEVERTAKIQDRFRAPWSAMACGCQANRETEALLVPAGFSDINLEHLTLSGCGPMLSSMIVGRATKAL